MPPADVPTIDRDMRRTRVVSIAAASLIAFVGGCGDDDTNDDPGLPNPAAVFCEDQGGTTSGSEPMCSLPDGSVVDAWEYYRANVQPDPGLPNPAAVFCEDQGGTTSGPEPMCDLPDGSVVDAWEYFRSEGSTD